MFKYAIAVLVLGLVVCGVFHPECREAVFNGTIGGLLTGAVHGPFKLYTIYSRTKGRKWLNATRARKIVLRVLVHDLVVGLLIGVVDGAIQLLRG